ncbi:MAG: hypothetical protein OJJ54_20410 [Pseudonocardia sp.]|nr:hypothetical protein [Pseudonocardia sp.]
MGLRERLVDPWAAVVGAVAGGMAWAVIPAGGVGVALGVGVAAVVYGVKVGSDALLNRRSAPGLPSPHDPPGPTELPEPPRGTEARRWLDRADAALHRLDETVEGAAAGVTREQVRDVRDKASTTDTAVRRLAGQATAFEQAMARIPARDLGDERARLASEIRRARSGEVRAEHESGLASVEQQLAAYSRLAQARETALARLQSAALGLESLNTRAVEVLAMAASSGDGPGRRVVDELGGELDALRGGVAEVERLARGEGPAPD